MSHGFGSDNHSGAHPKIWQALVEANDGSHAPSYGTDSITQKANRKFVEIFGEGTEVFFVFNGTAANVLGLSAVTRSFESVICADCAHLENDECGAPEALGHFKLRPLKSNNGKITTTQIEEALIRRGDQHYSQARVISITQPTELGTVYTLDEMRAIGDLARRNGMYFHVDGARLANAAEFLRVGLREITRDVGVDVLSFGGTKNGFLFGEAVVIFRPELTVNFKYLRKQMMQLPSKTRFISAQFQAYLDNGLWHEIAAHSNKMARLLSQELAPFGEVQICYPVEANAVFARIPKNYVSPLRQNYFFYVWNEKTFEVRWMTTFDTNLEDIRGFVSQLRHQQLRQETSRL